MRARADGGARLRRPRRLVRPRRRHARRRRRLPVLGGPDRRPDQHRRRTTSTRARSRRRWRRCPRCRRRESSASPTRCGARRWWPTSSGRRATPRRCAWRYASASRRTRSRSGSTSSVQSTEQPLCCRPAESALAASASVGRRVFRAAPRLDFLDRRPDRRSPVSRMSTPAACAVETAGPRPVDDQRSVRQAQGRSRGRARLATLLRRRGVQASRPAAADRRRRCAPAGVAAELAAPP